MEALLHQLQAFYLTLLWPFIRIAAALASAPALGEMMVPLRARLLLALILAMAVQPTLPALPQIAPVSLHGLVTVAEQVLIGAMLGMVFHLVLAALQLAGSLVAAQMGLSMATLNDPANGSSSDAMNALMYLIFMLLFFTLDGHLVLTQVLARSFQVWPVGGAGLGTSALQQLVLAVGWIFAAALMLALPFVFATMLVQIGSGFLNRAAPSLNLYSLGYSLIVVVGLMLVTLLVPTLPEHFVRMNAHVLDLLDLLAASSGATP
ncbi:flagellar biosynthetic protein FliR [Xanthomonas campestris pv. phormiicola]|nr:flagellar biosynthetic protein FliR [Xanthomonas campestris pv. phormiicola]UYC17856.1 flagellar biosynthetic protein FliR [Xanthomonas campestris pv. phormiicola]